MTLVAAERCLLFIIQYFVVIDWNQAANPVIDFPHPPEREQELCIRERLSNEKLER